MNKTQFLDLCAQITKDGPIAGWENLVREPELRTRHLAIRSEDNIEEWNVYRYDPHYGVKDLGKFPGKTPFDVYKAVPRKALT